MGIKIVTLVFLDLLGMTQNLSLLEKEDLDIKQQYATLIKEFILDKLKLELDAALKESNLSVLEGASGPGIGPTKMRVVNIPEFTTKLISDSIFIAIRCEREDYSAWFYLLIRTMAQFQRHLLIDQNKFTQFIEEYGLNRLLFRGAITNGAHYEEGDTIVSWALAKAALLEKKISIPAIVIDPSSLRLLKGPLRELCISLELKETIKKEMVFIDYLNYYSELNLPTPENYKQDYKQHYELISYNLGKCIFDKKLVNEKYYWLMAYHNESAPRWSSRLTSMPNLDKYKFMHISNFKFESHINAYPIHAI